MAANITSDRASFFDKTVPIAFAGTITTRTDNDTGVITTAVAHGILANDRVDVYWAESTRRGMNVTAVTATTVTVDVGAGTNLPALNYVVTIAKCAVENVIGL